MPDERSIDVAPLEALITAPLHALISADFSAARHFAAYLEEYGFEHGHAETPAASTAPTVLSALAAPADAAALPTSADPRGDLAHHHTNDHLGRLRMVSFQYHEPGPGGVAQPVVVKLPWLSLVPLPLMQVQEADFRFGVRLLGGVDAPDERRPLKVVRGSPTEEDPDPRRLRWRAVMADRAPGEGPADSAAPHRQVNLEVNVRMRQADVPAGISHLLALMGSAAHAVRPGGDVAPVPQPAPAAA